MKVTEIAEPAVPIKKIAPSCPPILRELLKPDK